MPSPAIDEMEVALAQRLFPTLLLWNRLEGRPRTHHFDRVFRVEVRDAQWMLCQQYRLGEFKGEDAGSPVSARIKMRNRGLTDYTPNGHPAEPYRNDLPIEATVERLDPVLSQGAMPVSLDLRLAAGRHFLKLLRQAGLGALEASFRERWPVVRPDPDDPANAAVCAHPRTWQVFAAAAQRGLDGGALIAHLDAAPTNTPHDAIPGIPAGDQAAIAGIGDAMRAWAKRWLVRPEPERAAWVPERLEYQCALTTEPGDGPERLVAKEYYHGALDWYSFDGAGRGPSEMPTSDKADAFIPVPLSFDGMPHARWWQFEEGQTNFKAIKPTSTDLGKLLLMEFALIYANDWFMLPVDLPVGSLARIEGLSVTNTFGERFWIAAADEATGESWRRWSMFTLADAALESDRTAGRELFVAPSAGKVQDSQSPEEIALIRDEMANHVWAIEQRIRLPGGEVRRGAEAAAETLTWHRRLAGLAETPPIDPPSVAALRYKAMTTVPEHWIPFVPVHLSGDSRNTRLQRAAMPRLMEAGPTPPDLVRPRSALIREGIDTNAAYFLNEEEVPRAGVHLFDGYQRTRWYGGKVLIWRGARKHAGRGEGSSGLAFDQLVPQRRHKAAPKPIAAPGHPPVELETEPFPTIGLEVSKDPAGGWNLRTTLTDFAFAPEAVSSPHIEGQGHAHLHVNGVKIARVYAEWMHIGDLPEGNHILSVELSANSHATLFVHGAPVTAEAVVTQPASMQHPHPVGEEAADGFMPTIALTVHEDMGGTYNLEVATTNFTMAPQHASGPHVNGEGHAHVWVDGEKVARLYGNWLHLPRLGAGEREIKVSLNTNDHRPYTVGSVPVAATETVIVEAGGRPGVVVHPHR